LFSQRVLFNSSVLWYNENMTFSLDSLNIQVKANTDLSSGEYSEIIALTSQAFERDYTPYMESFIFPAHILARLNGKLVSYVAIVTRWTQIGTGPLLRTAAIEGMATELSCRHRGFASQLMRYAVAEAQDCDIATLSTGINGFYSRLGWRVWEGPLYTRKEKELIAMPEEQGCVMFYALPKTPPLDITAPLSIEWRELEPW
jgi:aminoglycoside 2'-N-acetyltransferase I